MKDNSVICMERNQVSKGKFNAFMWGFVIAAFIFTGAGYAWRMVQVEPLEDRIVKLTEQRDNLWGMNKKYESLMVDDKAKKLLKKSDKNGRK